MGIMWKYLDKREASIEALKDYPSMRFILEQSPEEVIKASDDNSWKDDDYFSFCGSDVMQNRYEIAKEYMAWFQPAWKALKEEERYVLSNFYWTDDFFEQGKVLEDLCEKFHIERTSVYKKKNRAVDKLSAMLYGE